MNFIEIKKCITVSKERKIIFAILLLIIPITILFSSIYPLSYRYLLLIVSVPILILFSFNFKIISLFFIVSLFINVGFYYFSVSEIVTILLFISFLFTYKFKISDIKNKQILFFNIFILSVLPSYTQLFGNIEILLLFLHLIFFLIVIGIFSIAINSYKDMKYYFVIFLTLSFFNSIDVIVSTLLINKRAFGFAGIMFVDYVGYALVISFLTFIYSKRHRIKALILFSIFSVALVFTQTRSIWIVVITTIVLITFHIIIKRKLYEVDIKNAILIFFSLIILVTVLVFSISKVNQNITERLEIRKIEQTDNPKRLMAQINSLVTRYFIWSTAWNAFESSPVIGIGFYGFPFLSEKYSELDPFIYEVFVKDLTPHETFLAVLTEGGILGLLGFSVFIMFGLFYARKSIFISLNSEQKHYSILIFWLTVYTYLSMIVTDAWLWGHGLMLWGMLIGFSISNRKIISFNRNIQTS